MFQPFVGARRPWGRPVQRTRGKTHWNIRSDTAQGWLAVTEVSLRSGIKGGENTGKTLEHAGVLRSLHKLGVAISNTDFAFAKTTDVKPKSSWKQDDLRVVVFVQEKRTLRIIGGASAKFVNQLALTNP